MDYQETYAIEDGMAALTLINIHGDMLKCQIAEHFLPEINLFLNSAGLPKFENWFDKKQNFGWLFRLVITLQIKASFANEPENPLWPDNIRYFLQKWELPIYTDLHNLGIQHKDIRQLTQRLTEVNISQDLFLFTRKEILSNLETLDGLMEFSYII